MSATEVSRDRSPYRHHGRESIDIYIDPAMAHSNLYIFRWWVCSKHTMQSGQYQTQTCHFRVNVCPSSTFLCLRRVVEAHHCHDFRISLCASDQDDSATVYVVWTWKGSLLTYRTCFHESYDYPLKSLMENWHAFVYMAACPFEHPRCRKNMMS